MHPSEVRIRVDLGVRSPVLAYSNRCRQSSAWTSLLPLRSLKILRRGGNGLKSFGVSTGILCIADWCTLPRSGRGAASDISWREKKDPSRRSLPGPRAETRTDGSFSQSVSKGLIKGSVSPGSAFLRFSSLHFDEREVGGIEVPKTIKVNRQNLIFSQSCDDNHRCFSRFSFSLRNAGTTRRPPKRRKAQIVG